MLGKLHNKLYAGNKSRELAGLGSNYGPLPYPDMLHRGYGWGRMMSDGDFLPESVVWDYRSNARQTTSSTEKYKKNQYLDANCRKLCRAS